ncbi:MAG TPA: hypothetical protein VI893_03345, partial [Thermoplasmata archaeon]|nr:hypothetical protein [Thermoplasmata archaeon]
MSDHCHLCGTAGSGVIFSCISCGAAFCSVHHAKRSHGCKGRVAAPPVTPVPLEVRASSLRATSELDQTSKEPKLVNTLKEGNGKQASVSNGLFSALPNVDARAAAAAAILLRSAPVVKGEGGFTRPLEEMYVRITHLAEAGKTAEAWGTGSLLLKELETEPTMSASFLGIAADVAPKVAEADAAMKSASKAVEDGELYGAATYDARVLLGRAARNFREGHLDEAVALARHSRSAAKASLSELAVRLASRISSDRSAGPSGLESLAREDAKAAIREAARFGGTLSSSGPAENREFAIASIAVAWDLVRQAKAKGVDVTEFEMNIRQARSAVDLADSTRATRLAGRVREDVERRLERLARS